MFYGNFRCLEQYDFLPHMIKEALYHAKNNSVIDYETGFHEIQGERLFLNRVNLVTTNKEERFWEAHRKYLDIHVVLQGNERIGLNFIHNLKEKEYVEKDDFLSLEGEANGSLVLKKGDFLICYPEDAHMTCLKAYENPEEVQKVVYKIIVE